MFSCCMIVKDEEAFLGKCLNSINQVPEITDIVVADTGSTDRTKEIAREHGARVFDFAWVDDFSAARNFAAGQATNDWVIVLDADNELLSADWGQLRAFTKNPRFIGRVHIYEPGAGPEPASESLAARIYNRKVSHWQGTIHEQIAYYDREDHPPEHRLPVDVFYSHCGYLQGVYLAKNKFERNSRLLLRELERSPNDPYLHFQLGKSYLAWGTDREKACECFEKAITLTTDFTLEYVKTLFICYGYALINNRQFEKALNLREYLPRFRDNPYFRFMLAHAYMNNSLLVEAVELFRSCAGDPVPDITGVTSYLAWYNMGVILE